MIFNKDFLKGTLSTLILSLLNKNGRMYGYEICQHTKQLSKDTILLTEGAIYPALHKLEKKGVIVSSKEMVNGRMRKYYSINSVNQSVVQQQIHSLQNFMDALHLIIRTN